MPAMMINLQMKRMMMVLTKKRMTMILKKKRKMMILKKMRAKTTLPMTMMIWMNCSIRHKKPLIYNVNPKIQRKSKDDWIG